MAFPPLSSSMRSPGLRKVAAGSESVQTISTSSTHSLGTRGAVPSIEPKVEHGLCQSAFGDESPPPFGPPQKALRRRLKLSFVCRSNAILAGVALFLGVSQATLGVLLSVPSYATRDPATLELKTEAALWLLDGACTCFSSLALNGLLSEVCLHASALTRNKGEHSRLAIILARMGYDASARNYLDVRAEWHGAVADVLEILGVFFLGLSAFPLAAGIGFNFVGLKTYMLTGISSDLVTLGEYLLALASIYGVGCLLYLHLPSAFDEVISGGRTEHHSTGPLRPGVRRAVRSSEHFELEQNASTEDSSLA